ncbi:MAG: DUF47 domain-containing protein [Candidatus Helarchaeota archaeon]
MKGKKRKLKDIFADYQSEFMKGIKLLNTIINNFINNKVDKEKAREVIISEKKADRLKEEFIEYLYKNKRALPFLVEDRYKIITSLDKVLGVAEMTARSLAVYPFNFNSKLEKDFSNLNRLCFEIMEALIKATTVIETDFDKTKEYLSIISSLRRSALDLKFQMLAKTYERMDNHLEIILFDNLISLLYEAISRAEEISDFLNGLIIKYPSR